MQSKHHALNLYNFWIAKAMSFYWQDVLDGKLPRVLWEQLEERIRKHYIERAMRK